VTFDSASLLFVGHLFLIVIDILFMPSWLVYMETYGIDFLTLSFVIYISKHHHHHHHQGRNKVKGLLLEKKKQEMIALSKNRKQMYYRLQDEYIKSQNLFHRAPAIKIQRNYRGIFI
jgi:hypothetical protein